MGVSRQCDNVLICQCANVGQCADVLICQCANGLTQDCGNTMFVSACENGKTGISVSLTRIPNFKSLITNHNV